MRVRAYHDLILSELPQLWELVLQLMDDIKESVRQSAAKTAGISIISVYILIVSVYTI